MKLHVERVFTLPSQHLWCPQFCIELVIFFNGNAYSKTFSMRPTRALELFEEFISLSPFCMIHREVDILFISPIKERVSLPHGNPFYLGHFLRNQKDVVIRTIASSKSPSYPIILLETGTQSMESLTLQTIYQYIAKVKKMLIPHIAKTWLELGCRLQKKKKEWDPLIWLGS